MKIWLILVGIVIGAHMFLRQKPEQPVYQVVSRSDNIEIRRYQPMLIAKVSLSIPKDQALNTGFKILAKYISQNNIAMTAPVILQKITNKWQVSFIMPSKYQLKDLKPAEQVTFETLKQSKYVAIRYSGINNDIQMQRHTIKIMDFIEKNHIKTTKDIIYAFYNPPWTLPILRRNEILIRLEE